MSRLGLRKQKPSRIGIVYFLTRRRLAKRDARGMWLGFMLTTVKGQGRIMCVEGSTMLGAYLHWQAGNRRILAYFE
jgi:hypothetical protein